jgi:hypothetical protein
MYIYEPDNELWAMIFMGLWPVNGGGLFKMSASKKGLIFGDGPLKKPTSVNRFQEIVIL